MASTTVSDEPLEFKNLFELTDQERKLFTFLQKAVDYHQLPTVLRVAGGWVRDKINQGQSHDIDIAVEGMTGCQLVEKIGEYAKSTDDPGVVGSVGVIKANPDQSKHLETATVKIYNLSIDFVNLRAEEYADNSRIPTMRLGTPLEDALRRDLTINALFYNLKTECVEDYSRRGKDDLENGIIRTPLDPTITLRDDPLRALRTVRFASRFKFQIESSLSHALRDPDVKLALLQKISRERVLAELDGMMMGKHPYLAIHTLLDHNLFSAVFDASADIRNDDVALLLKKLEARCGTEPDALVCRLRILAACVLPFRQMSIPEKKGKTITAAEHVLRERLKAKGSDVADVLKIHTAVDAFTRLVTHETQTRLETGLALRACGENWRLAVDLAIAEREVFSGDEGRWRARFEEFSRRITDEWKLEGVWNLKPLLNGNDIQQRFGVKGVAIGGYSSKCLELQLMHPDASQEEIAAMLAADPPAPPAAAR